MANFETIHPAALDAARGGLARASSSTNALLQQQMMMISESLRDVARQQQSQISPIMIAMLGLAMSRA